MALSPWHHDCICKGLAMWSLRKCISAYIRKNRKRNKGNRKFFYLFALKLDCPSEKTLMATIAWTTSMMDDQQDDVDDDTDDDDDDDDDDEDDDDGEEQDEACS